MTCRVRWPVARTGSDGRIVIRGDLPVEVLGGRGAPDPDRRGRLEERRGRRLAVTTVLVSGAPAVVLGWTATTTQVVWWGIGLAAPASALAAVIVSRSVREQDATQAPAEHVAR